MKNLGENRVWRAVAPSNIALIKYMGKIDTTVNRPTNSSLSYTLGNLQSAVELSLRASGESDAWEPLRVHNGREIPPFSMSPKGRDRFLSHLAFLKSKFGVEKSFLVRSGNDFPSDCGLASSASSFAALTMAANSALSELTGRDCLDAKAAAELSRQGSGSSCRSFFAPWSVWKADGAEAVPELAEIRLAHQVVVVDEHIKSVSSSEAHKRVTSSLLFEGRPERAEKRVQSLIESLRSGRWSEAFEITWAEFWDMHALFETSRPSFGYMTKGSLDVLSFVRDEVWKRDGFGPLVTMDAGPNVHLLYLASDSRSQAQAVRVQEALGGMYKVISSEAVP